MSKIEDTGIREKYLEMATKKYLEYEKQVKVFPPLIIRIDSLIRFAFS